MQEVEKNRPIITRFYGNITLRTAIYIYMQYTCTCAYIHMYVLHIYR